MKQEASSEGEEENKQIYTKTLDKQQSKNIERSEHTVETKSTEIKNKKNTEDDATKDKVKGKSFVVAVDAVVVLSFKTCIFNCSENQNEFLVY